MIAPVLSFTEKKLISLGNKYFSIPLEHLPYYPKIPSVLRVQIDDEHEQAPLVTHKKKRELAVVDAMVELAPNALAPSMPVKVRPGRPKKKVVIASRPP